MKRYLIRDKQGNIVICEPNYGKDDYEWYRVDIDKFKKNVFHARYLLPKESVEARREFYMEELKEEFDIIEVEVEMDITILNN